jgi:hypothetical protein
LRRTRVVPRLRRESVRGRACCWEACRQRSSRSVWISSGSGQNQKAHTRRGQNQGISNPCGAMELRSSRSMLRILAAAACGRSLHGMVSARRPSISITCSDHTEAPPSAPTISEFSCCARTIAASILTRSVSRCPAVIARAEGMTRLLMRCWRAPRFQRPEVTWTAIALVSAC